jgi:hypothetical protein
VRERNGRGGRVPGGGNRVERRPVREGGGWEFRWGEKTVVVSAVVLHKQGMRTDGNIRAEETMACCIGTGEQ